MNRPSLSRMCLLFSSVMVFSLSALAQPEAVQLRAGEGLQWFRGNTHSHTLWSDAEMAPELLVAWYKANGYHFLCLSDHNVLNDGSMLKWWPVQEKGPLTPERLEKLQAEFGKDWVETRTINGRPYMKLKALPELQRRFESPGSFMLIAGEEITSPKPAVHMGALNIRELIYPALDVPESDAIQFAVDHVAEQSERFNAPMLAHLNHPNFSNGVRAEDIAAVPEEHFFEVYNGHPDVHNDGHAERQRVSTDQLWDIALSLRLHAGSREILYGLATDDTHDYYVTEPSAANAGRGWIHVLAADLNPNTITAAINSGRFYASSGVTLEEVSMGPGQYTVKIQPEPGLTFTTQFFGTRRGFDATATPRKDAQGKELKNVTAQYGESIGALLFETTENPATYPLQGDELYVRARVVSSKGKANAKPGEMERAWTQPWLRP